MSKNFYVFMFSCFLFISCTNQPADSLKEYELSIEEKIGQMIMVGFRGTEVSEESDIYKLISENNIGGVVLYDRDLPSKDSIVRNIKDANQLRQLNFQLQNISPRKLLIGIDEEGGWVSRLKRRYGFQYHQSHKEIGDLNNIDSTRVWANHMAKELSGLGINMNFAPVVDLNSNPESPAIGKIERSFSDSVDVVVKNSKIFIEEHRKLKVLCVPKHFPGHGSAREDTHMGFADVSESWNENELLPYELLLKDDYCDILMTAHVYNDQLDTLPGTLSSKIINDLLRGKLKWDKVIISDDMQMGAINNFFSFEEGVEKAVLAGVDIILLSNNSAQAGYDPDIAIRVIEKIKSMLEEGLIDEDRIEKSFERIQELKKKI